MRKRKEMMPHIALLYALIFVCHRKLKFESNTQGIRNVRSDN